MNVPIVSAGLGCLIAAVVGGGMKALGVEIPTLASGKRQVMLALLGAAIVWFGISSDDAPPKPSSEQAGPSHPKTIDETPSAPVHTADMEHIEGTWFDDKTAIWWDQLPGHVTSYVVAKRKCTESEAETKSWHLPTLKQMLVLTKDDSEQPVKLSRYVWYQPTGNAPASGAWDTEERRPFIPMNGEIVRILCVVPPANDY